MSKVQEMGVPSHDNQRFHLPAHMKLPASGVSNTEQVINDLHDALKSFDDVQGDHFVDAVTKQAALNHLVFGTNAPVKLFSPTFVTGLSAEQTEAIASESMKTRNKRRRLAQELEKLREGHAILAKP